jgi:soluble lytic murein transglycosylase-like protein
MNNQGECVLYADLKPNEGRLSWVRVLLTELGLLVVASVLVGVATTLGGQLGSAPRLDAPPPPATLSALPDEGPARSDVSGTRIMVERSISIMAYADRFGIPTDLSAAIYDIAVEEGITPELAFRLVRVESNFQRGALSSAGAWGYTQVRLPTARVYLPDAKVSDLRQRDTNLRLGFRYLRDLLRRFDGDLTLALVAYNRGPTLVDSIASSGGDPMNGYSDMVLAGVRGGLRTAPILRKGSD